MSGLTSDGFVAERTPELKLKLEQMLLDAFGAVNLNPSAVFGQLVGLTARQQADLWARLEEVYFSQYPSSAAGANLDRVVSLNGLTRLPARATTVLATVTGLVGTVLTAGRLASISSTGESFILSEEVELVTAQSIGGRVSVQTLADNTNYVINLDGAAYTYNSGSLATEASVLTGLMALLPVSVTSELSSGTDGAWLDLSYDTPQPIVLSANLGLEFVDNYASFAAVRVGPLTVPIGGLTDITTPVAGWTAVNNRFPGTPGRLLETDAELRQRRAGSLKMGGQSTLDSITSQLAQLPGVLAHRVAVNNTAVTDAEGIPPQHIRAIVDGGIDEEIAKILFRYVAAGIGYYGSETELVQSEVDPDSFYTVKFDRPVNVPFYVTTTIKRSPLTPTDVIEQVRTALVEYAAGLNIAEPVLYTRLFGPISEVIGDGAYVQSLTIGLVSPGTGTVNITPTPAQRLVLTPERVQVFAVL